MGARIVSIAVKVVISLALVGAAAPPARAQTPAEASPRERATNAGPRKQLATIIFAGLGGAVLGLSTLSFYGRPQDKLSNIAIGFAFGVIGGTAYVTYNAATNPQDFYGQRSWMEFERERAQARFEAAHAPKTLGFGFTF